MSWTFNPPPGWPAQPVGWQPPPGWAPDPSWPPPPAGWQFWVPVEDSPARSHSAPVPPDGPVRRPWYQHRWAAPVAALAVLLVGCLGGAAAAVVTGRDERFAAPPEPTASPGPQPTAAPSPAPSGAGLSAGQERTGEGPAIVELYLPEGAVRTLTITFTGTEEHQLNYVDEEGEVIGFIGSGSGDYTGTHLVGEGAIVTTEVPAALDIVKADGGSWTVRMQDITEAPTWPQVSSGTGATVLRFDPNAVPEPTSVTGTHEGESNFIVWAYSSAEFGDRLLFNEVGQFSGPSQAEVAEDVTILEIQADGAWTLAPG